VALPLRAVEVRRLFSMPRAETPGFVGSGMVGPLPPVRSRRPTASKSTATSWVPGHSFVPMAKADGGPASQGFKAHQDPVPVESVCHFDPGGLLPDRLLASAD